MSKFLSLAWFKSKVEQAVENVISKKIDKLIEEEDAVQEKPYLNIKLVNNILTIVLTDGNIICKQDATEEDFIKAKSATTEDQLFRLVICAEVSNDRKEKAAKIKKANAMLAGLDILKGHDEFVVEGSTVYFKGINRSLPQILVEEILEIVNNYEGDWTQDEEYQSLKRFFMWCCLNPRAEVANELYRFLKENSFRITKQGFFVALRNVVTLHGGTEVVDFVSNAYTKIKAVWKKSPTDYSVFFKNGEYKLIHNNNLYEESVEHCDNCNGEGKYWDEDEEKYVICEVCEGSGEVSNSTPVYHGTLIGNLTELYLNLPNMSENRFTDDWTKTFDIRIGKVVSMPKEECNWSTQDCAAAGLN